MTRIDAQENQARIRSVARIAPAEKGELAINQIEQRAGVGAGTLYRNFRPVRR